MLTASRMPQPFLNSTTLSQSLDELSRDPRLARLFSQNDADTCALYLWLLEIKQNNNNREYRLLFGWVIPRAAGTPSQWKRFNSLSAWKVAPYEFRIRRLHTYSNGSIILNLVQNLCEGRTLGEACEQVNIPKPEKDFDQFRLAMSSQQIANFFAVRPVVFLETSFSTLSIIDQLKPPTSSIDDIPAFVGSLYRCNKLNLFWQSSGENFPKVDELAKTCLNNLQEETGLDFRNADSQRLGNLEWICFPAANQYERSQVNITKSARNQVEVEILSEALPSEMPVLIRCRAKNADVIVLDQCQTTQIVDRGKTSVTFQAQEQISSFTITVWTQQPNSTTWEIWYEHSTPTLGQIDMNVGSSGPEINLPSNWLQEFANSKIRERVERSQCFNQVNYERVQIGGNNVDPWVLESKRIRDFSQKLFPPQSGGHFFLKGWVGDEPGLLSFFEWLQRLTNDFSASKVLIIDPFFDSPGILKLIARVSAVQAEYVVLTNTQVRSDNDSPESANNSSEPQRATRLRDACYQFQFLLKNFKFELLDVRKKEGDKKNQQIFHDRYILVFNQYGNVKVGYHLSNSIQGRTKNYPLLITPIPGDILPLVEDYIATELLASSNPERQVITIFSSVHETATPAVSQRLQGLAAIPYANLFFAALLQDVNLAFLSETDLGNLLHNQGFYDTTTHEFNLSEANLSQIDAPLQKFTQTLLRADTDYFAKLWAGLGGWLDRTLKGEEYLNKIETLGGTGLATKLHTFLLQAPEHLNLPISSYEPNTQTDALQLSQFIKQDFVSAVQNADELLKQTDWGRWQICLQDYGIRYATQALMALEPAKLVSILTGLKQIFIDKPDLKPDQFCRLHYTLSFTIQQILLQLIVNQYFQKQDDSLVKELLKSDVPSLRAIAAYSLSPLTNTQDNLQESKLQEAFALLNNLDAMEIIYTLAEWIFKLRVRANVAREENEPLQKIRLAIFAQMRQVFPANVSPKELLGINRRLSGPCEGGWAKSTTDDLLQLLVNDAKIQVDDITHLWLSILCNRLYAHLRNSTEQDRRGDSENKNASEDGHKLWLKYLNNPKKNGLVYQSEPSPDFFVSDGLELINVCLEAIARSTSDCRQAWLAEINKITQSAQILYRPFLRSRNSQIWERAAICLLWLQIFANLFIQTYNSNEITSDSESIKELKEFTEQLDKILEVTDELKALQNQVAIFEFAQTFTSRRNNCMD